MASDSDALAILEKAETVTAESMSKLLHCGEYVNYGNVEAGVDGGVMPVALGYATISMSEEQFELVGARLPKVSSSGKGWWQGGAGGLRGGR